MQLRPYQQQMVDTIRGAFGSGHKAPLLVSPTGSGKTVLFSYIALHASKKGNSVLVLVHRNELVRQTCDTLTQFGVNREVIVTGRPFMEAKVQVASVWALVRRLGKINWSPNLIVVDEAHHATGKTTWGKVIKHYSKARVLGVTATPERLDGQGLGIAGGGFFDTMIKGPSVAYLVDNGYLSPPIVYSVPSLGNAMDGVKKSMGDWARGETAKAVNKATITGDAIAHYRKHAMGEPAIAFCVSVEHAEQVAADFNSAGIASVSIDGKMDRNAQRRCIKELASGAIKVLTSCELISEGVDVPVVSVAILLRPTMSLAMALQQMGRVLRIFPGKKRALILDHVGNCVAHGLPDDDREWALDAEKRSKRKSTDEATIGSRQCPECYRAHPTAPTCPDCGHIYQIVAREIEVVPGELEKLERRAARKEEKSARTFEDFKNLGVERGYKNPWGWALNRMVARARSEKALYLLAEQTGRKNPGTWAAFKWAAKNERRA